MKFILVVLIVAGFVCVIMSFLLLFAKYLPFVWDREEWKIWKECWACDVVGYEDRGCTEFGEKYFAQNIIGWTTKTIMRLFLLSMVKKNPPYLKIQVPTNACFQVITNPTPTNLH